MPVTTMVDLERRPDAVPLTDEQAQRNGLKPGVYGILTEHTGRVLAKYEKNGYDDSDFCAIVETDDGQYDTITYATTRYWTYLNTATVDATPDVVARYEAFRQAQFDSLRRDREATERRMLKVGATVRSTTKRGKNVGVQGVVGVVGPNAYSRARDYGFGLPTEAYRVKVDDGDTQRWLSGDRVEILVDGEWVEPVSPGKTFNLEWLVADQLRAPQVVSA